MKLTEKAQAALDVVVDRFRAGDLSPVVDIIRIQRDPNNPAAKWSLSNQVIAYLQTDSLDCRGYRQWQAAGRQVKKGSQAAYILAPLRSMQEDKETGEKKQILYGFKGVAVFAYHDTEGEEIPQVDYAPQELPPLTDVAQRLGVNVVWQPLPPDRIGQWNASTSQIDVDTHDPAVFFHELAHAAHTKIDGPNRRAGNDPERETVAEFTAAVLMHLYGLDDRSGNSWRYIQHYHKDPLRAAIKALSTVEKVLCLLEITQERGQRDE